MPQNILVIGELDNGAPSATTLELLGGAQSLADGGTVAITLLGSGASAAAAQASGAARAYVSDDATYDTFRGDQWLPAVQAAVEQAAPGLILMGQTTAGRELGPRLAFRLDTAVAMDCVNVSATGGAIEATRPCYGGNAQATYTFATSPAIATVRAKSFEPTEGAGAAETADLPAAGESRVTVTGKEVTESEGLPLTDA
ncbi:MAG: hypothetical protein WD942_08080, partial [Dehalococcoidia bacterium]